MSLLHHAPRIDVTTAMAIARQQFGVNATAEPLPSERDQNFLLTTGERRRFVLKVANAMEARALLEAQDGAMAAVASSTSLAPQIVPTTSGEEIGDYRDVGGTRHLVRLLTWIDGTPLARVPHHSIDLLRDLGRKLGRLDLALQGFDHPAIHRPFHWDLALGFEIVERHLGQVSNVDLRRQVASAVERIGDTLSPIVPRLPRTVIHGDANDYNVIVAPGPRWERDRQIAGFIDFGDMVHSYTVGDVAVAVAYAMLGKSQPLQVAAEIVAGYCESRALNDDELAAVFPLAQLRLCMSVCVAADQQAQRPGDEYLAISQVPIAAALPQLSAVPHDFALAMLRHAAGLDPMPRSSRLMASLRSARVKPVIESMNGAATTLDLSPSSTLLHGDPGAIGESRLTERIEHAMRDRQAVVGVGRYGEPRLLYSSPLFAAAQHDDERRTIHLGVDLFAPAGTEVHAPLDGIVEISVDNAQALDYGPVIVLRHEADDGHPFFTLYGHLSRASLRATPAGRRVNAGEVFAEVGTAEVNGGWTPHLHFQLIADLLGLGRDFPGVCRSSERAAWMAISPDPSVLLGVDAAYPAGKLDTKGMLERRRTLIGRNLSIGYRDPVHVVRGWKQYLYDSSGRRYLDGYNNVPHVGHGHPRVVEAAAEQMRVLNTNTRYLHESLERFAERLVATLPEPLRVCYFVNSGSEANELALRLAHAHTHARDTIVLDAAYHGNTSGLIALSPYKFYGPGGEGAQPWVHVAPVPDVYRGAHKASDPDAAAKYAASVTDLLSRLDDEDRRVCAFLAETCPSVAGQILLPEGYLAAVYGQVRRAGGVCVADEVQTAYGRMGSHFYAFEAHDVVPDIVVLGKPIGNGYPLGAVVTTAEIAASFDNGMEFFSTFGGSTVSCAVGLAVLDVVQEEALQAHAQRVGAQLTSALRELETHHPLVGDVRGGGLFLGVELVRDPDTLEPATEEAAYVSNRLREEGILIGTDGPSHNVLKIRPPMPFNSGDADQLVAALDRALQELAVD